MAIRSEVIKPEPGQTFAIHVFTPALQHRMSTGSKIPVMALRSSKSGFHRMKLFAEIECLGPSKMTDLFDKPLPATGGRGVAILMTDFPIQVTWDERQPPSVIDTSDSRNPQDVLKEVVERYTIIDTEF